MKYLLDTHALIWYLEDSKRLPQKTKRIIADTENTIFICSASLWEITIKTGLDKLKLDLSLDEFFSIIENSDFNMLDIENEYLLELARLPDIHKDPFDRLIVSTAVFEELTIITADENICKYDVSCLWR